MIPTTDTTVDVEWSAGTDGGSGVHGYSIEWSTSAGTLPDATEDVTDTLTTSIALAEGNSWYLHIRAQDYAGNWVSDAVFYRWISPIEREHASLLLDDQVCDRVGRLAARFAPGWPFA